MTDVIEIVQSPVFLRAKKKRNPQQVRDLDKAVRAILASPTIGVMKVGDLQGVRIYKFKSQGQQVLLAYEVVETKLLLYAFGSHENFYRDLKKHLND